MKLKKNEDQRVGALVLLRRRSKILTGGNMETKCGKETEGHAEIALPRDPSHIQSPNADIIMDAGKSLLTGA